jgi:predicted nucleotidyltransferase
MKTAFDHLTSEEKSALEEVTTSLGRMLPERSFRLILFGSKARGDVDSDSDHTVSSSRFEASGS